MGLFDNYNAINSKNIRQYQGSTVPELVNVSQQMQQRYDATAEAQDYITRFMNNMQALPQDQPALKEWSQQFREKLKQQSQRPDLENALRETTMLARDVPEGYAPFAQAIKEQQEFEKGVLSNDKLLPGTKEGIIAMSRAKYKGLQKDPSTGKYVGRYTGYNAVNDIDFNKKIEDYIKGAFPTTSGYSTENVNGEWIIKRGGKSVVMEPGRIAQIVRDGIASDPEMQAWLKQQEDLGTYQRNWGNVKPEDLDLDKPTSYTKQVKQGKKTVDVPMTLKELVQPYLDKGIPLSDALMSIERAGISNSWIERGQKYAMEKFKRNDHESEFGLSSNTNFWNALNHQDKLSENQVLQATTTMTVGGLPADQMKNFKVSDFERVKGEAENTHKGSMQEYSDWLDGINDGQKKIKLADSRVVYKDASGKEIDVTRDANTYRNKIRYMTEQKNNMTAIETAAQRESGWDKIPAETKQKAQAAYDKAYQYISHTTELSANPEQERKDRAQREYDRVLQSDPRYSKYQEALKTRLSGTTVGSDLFTFSSKRSDDIGKMVENMVSGLGLKDGFIPVKDKEGNQITADQWEQMKGDMKAIGVTYTGDPNDPVALVMRVYKDIKGKKTLGEDMIVKIPNTNIQSLMDRDMSPEQRSYFNSAIQLVNGVNNPARTYFQKKGNDPNIKQDIYISANRNPNDPRKGWTVKVGGTEANLTSFKEILDFIHENNK